MPIVEVKDLKVYFSAGNGLFKRRREFIRAVDDVCFTIEPGTTVGLVGESGSGKSTLGRALIRLVEPTSGSIKLFGNEIVGMSESAFRPLRRRVQMIFQDPFGSLNPRMTIGKIISEPLEIHYPEISKAERRDRVRKLLEMVRLEADHTERYPHEFSGGQRQRIGIARALAVEPEFLICDEPVSALDVSVQAGIVNLLQDIQERFGLACLFIAHDLAVVEHVSQRVLVMHRGRIIEDADAKEIYTSPQHEYTRRLLASVPKL